MRDQIDIVLQISKKTKVNFLFIVFATKRVPSMPCACGQRTFSWISLSLFPSLSISLYLCFLSLPLYLAISLFLCLSLLTLIFCPKHRSANITKAVANAQCEWALTFKRRISFKYKHETQTIHPMFSVNQPSL